MNDIEKLADYRSAIAAVRQPKLEDKTLTEYMTGARSKALCDLDAAIEMRNPAQTVETISKTEARDRGMVPVGVVGHPDSWWHKVILRDMARDNITTALVADGPNGSVSVWRIPNPNYVTPISIDE